MASWTSRRARWRCTAAMILALASGWAGSASGDLSSPSFTIRGGHVSAGGSASLSSSSFVGTGATGQGEALGLSGSTSDLATNAPGFMPILVGALPSLDSDGDGIQFFLDFDDDGDGARLSRDEHWGLRFPG